MMFAPRYTVWHCGYLKGGRKMNLCNCLQCNTNNCPAAKEFNDLQKQSNAQLDELHRVSEALGTNEGHSSVTHIEILKGENAALREQLKQVEAGYATRNDEVTGLLGMNAELREQLAALRKDAERYRWLRNDSFKQFVHPIVVSQTRTKRGVNYIGPVFYESLDAAIDAAMKEEVK